MEFEFATAGRIVFGAGASRRLGGEAAALGRRALVVTGARPERSAELRRLLDDHHVMHTLFSVAGEPTTALVEAGTRPLALPSAPFIAVPTTAGTGAEVTRNAVLGSPAHRIKVSLRSPFMLPRLALVDPELTYSMPPALTAATGFDALTQLLEAFVSRDATPLTDGICREGLRRGGRSLASAVADGADRQAREEMCIASLFGGLALANARLGAVHGIAGPFGGMFPAPHGAVCGRLLPLVAAANISALRQRAPGSPALVRYQEAAGVLTGNSRAEPEDGAEWLQALCTRLAIPPLSAYGFSAQSMGLLIERARHASSMRGNPVDLTAHELEHVLLKAE